MPETVLEEAVLFLMVLPLEVERAMPEPVLEEAILFLIVLLLEEER